MDNLHLLITKNL